MGKFDFDFAYDGVEAAPDWLYKGVDSLWDLMPEVGEGMGVGEVLTMAVKARGEEIGPEAAMQELVEFGQRYGPGNLDVISTYPRAYDDDYGQVVDHDDFLLRFKRDDSRGLPELIIDPMASRQSPNPFSIKMPGGVDSFYIPSQGGVLHTVTHDISPYAEATGAAAIWGASRRAGTSFEDTLGELRRLTKKATLLPIDPMRNLLPEVMNDVLNSGRYQVYGPERGRILTWDSITPERSALLGVEKDFLLGDPVVRSLAEKMPEILEGGPPDPDTVDAFRAALMAPDVSSGVLPLHVMGVQTPGRTMAVPTGITRNQIENGNFLMHHNNYFVAAPWERYN